MDLRPELLVQLRLPGERYDNKACFNSRDFHFNCLDGFKDETDNHFKCLNTLESWRQKCDPVVRRLQLQERDRLRIDQRLYTAEQLQDYNRRKNIQWRDFATLKGDF